MKIFFIGLLSMMVFAIIKGSIFIFAEDELDAVLIEKTQLDHNIRPLILGGMSAAVAILCASNIQHFIRDKYKIQPRALTDCLGVIIGTLVVVIGYTIYKNYGGSLHIATRPNRDKDRDNRLDNEEDKGAY
jgi:hypothetical protein